MHKSVINWKKQIIKFNSINCIEKSCFSNSMPYIEFAIESKPKNIIGSKKSVIVNPRIDI